MIWIVAGLMTTVYGYLTAACVTQWRRNTLKDEAYEAWVMSNHPEWRNDK